MVWCVYVCVCVWGGGGGGGGRRREGRRRRREGGGQEQYKKEVKGCAMCSLTSGDGGRAGRQRDPPSPARSQWSELKQKTHETSLVCF